MTLSLQVLSNLHLELNDIINFQNVIVPCADVFVLLGDIGCPMQTNLSYFLAWCSVNFQYVLYVPGNNEYYSLTGQNDMNAINDSLAKICGRFDNVFLLNNETLLIESKYLFIGSTLWSCQVPQYEAPDLDDYKYIYKTKQVLITHDDVHELYVKNKKWIEKQVAMTIDSGHIPIILTHHCPFVKRTNVPTFEFDAEKQIYIKQYNVVDPYNIRLWCTAAPQNTFDYNEGYLIHSNRYMNISNLQLEYNYKCCYQIAL